VDPLYAPYLPHLNRVLLSRLLSQLSQVYSSVRLSYISELIAPLNEPWNLPMTEGTNPVVQELWDASKLEAFVMGCARRGELLVRIDHADESIAFVTDLFSSPTPGASTSASVPLAQLQTSPAELIRTRFSRLATALSTSLTELYPTVDEVSRAQSAFAALVKAADEERHQLAIRRVMIIRRAELLAELSVRKKQEEESRRAEAARKKQEEDNKNALATARRREAERIQREVEAAHKEEAKTLAKTLIAKGGLKINDEVCSYQD
jgi:translation initiation factor 3 subunit A